METNELIKKDDGLEISLTSLLNLNKAYMGQITDNAMRAVTDGHYDSITALVIAKKGLELFTQLEKKVRPIAEHHARLGKGEVYTKFNTDITQKESGVKYDFSACDDAEWETINAKMELYSNMLKEREKFLKTITKPMTIVDQETGDILELKPPIRSGKLGLNISIT